MRPFRAMGLFFIGCLICLWQTNANASSFGTKEKVYFIANIQLKGSQQEELYLGHKTTTKYLFLPYWQEDDGYVIGYLGDLNRYTFLPLEDKVTTMKQIGLLPNPFPTYEIPFEDTPKGYYWILAFFLFLIIVGQQLLTKYKIKL